MVAYIIITQKDKRFNLLLMNINKFSEGGSVFKQLRYFLELVDKSHNDRRSNILLKGYIYVHEESCTNSECPLKRYLQEIEKTKKHYGMPGDKSMISGSNNNNTTNINVTTNEPITNKVIDATGNTSNIGMPIGTGTAGDALGGNSKGEKGKHSHMDDDLYLYQYVMTMYQNGISKFSLSTTLRINYSFFLMERMNNTKKALIESAGIECEVNINSLVAHSIAYMKSCNLLDYLKKMEHKSINLLFDRTFFTEENYCRLGKKSYTFTDVYDKLLDRFSKLDFEIYYITLYLADETKYSERLKREGKAIYYYKIKLNIELFYNN